MFYSNSGCLADCVLAQHNQGILNLETKHNLTKSESQNDQYKRTLVRSSSRMKVDESDENSLKVCKLCMYTHRAIDIYLNCLFTSTATVYLHVLQPLLTCTATVYLHVLQLFCNHVHTQHKNGVRKSNVE